jgi:hypothetical protein
MDTLLTVIVLWLSANFGLPANHDQPKIEIVPSAQIAALLYGQSEVLALGPASGQGVEIVAVYDSERRTILLPAGWTGSTPAELSILVHEVVHHLQKTANLRYECPAAREELAYEAQDKWLGLFGRSLLSEFDIDPFTLKVKTVCGY